MSAPKQRTTDTKSGTPPTPEANTQKREQDECPAFVEQGALHCPLCRTVMTGRLRCPKCGTPWCPSCGDN